MTTMDTWFRATARRYPETPALEVGAEKIRYRQLDVLADRVGAAITAAAGGAPRAVGILAERSVRAYAGYLGALRAGATVVPLNPSFPTARNAAICRAAGVDTVVVDDTGASLAAEVLADTTASLVPLTGPRWWVDLPSTVDTGGTARPAEPDDVGYILFTSGSTGRPKGVPIRHRQLSEYLAYCADRYQIGPGSRVSQAFDLTFDPSVFDMFVAWYAGGTVVVPQSVELLMPARFIGERRISHWFSVPSVISLADRLRGLTPGCMPNLRWSLFAGEQLTLDQARAWAAAAPASTIENLYGPTELTITCTDYRLPPSVAHWPSTPNGTVPIGQPYPHLDAILIAEDGTVSADDGELCMRGNQRFDGYLDPADNRDRFVRASGGTVSTVVGLPAEGDYYRTGDRVRWQDGELVHLGRTDQQLKVGGYRVEPGEIECVLREHPDVHEAIVLGVEAAPGRVELHAFYTGKPDTERAVQAHAQRRLPGYFVPTRLVHLTEFPTNANGKTDRGAVRGVYVHKAQLSV